MVVMQFKITENHVTDHVTDPDAATACTYYSSCGRFAYYTVSNSLQISRVCPQHLEPQIAFMQAENARTNRSEVIETIHNALQTCNAAENPEELFVDAIILLMRTGGWECVHAFCNRVYVSTQA